VGEAVRQQRRQTLPSRSGDRLLGSAQGGANIYIQGLREQNKASLCFFSLPSLINFHRLPSLQRTEWPSLSPLRG
jgi:hypothetical protein